VSVDRSKTLNPLGFMFWGPFHEQVQRVCCNTIFCQLGDSSTVLFYVVTVLLRQHMARSNGVLLRSQSGAGHCAGTVCI
jgi:hypothetical protein